MPKFSYVAMDQKGKETKGTWRMDGEKACFDPEGDKPEVCHTSTPCASRRA